MRTIQYAPQTGPVRVPVASETITLDKWAPAYPTRVITRKGGARLEFTQPLLITALADQTPAGAWIPTLSKAGVRPAQGKAHGYTWHPSTAAAAAGATGGTVQGGSQMMRPIVIQYQTMTGPMRQPSVIGLGPVPDYIPPCLPEVPTKRLLSVTTRHLFEPTFGVVIATPVMSWTGLYLDRTSARRRQPAARGGASDPQFVQIIPPVLPDLSWLSPSVSVPVRRRTLRGIARDYFSPPWAAILVTVTGWGRLLGLKRNRLVNKQ